MLFIRVAGGRAGPRTLPGCAQHSPHAGVDPSLLVFLSLLSDLSNVLAFLSGVGMKAGSLQGQAQLPEEYHTPFKYLDAQVIFRANFTSKNHHSPAPGIKFCFFLSLRPNTIWTHI